MIRLNVSLSSRPVHVGLEVGPDVTVAVENVRLGRISCAVLVRPRRWALRQDVGPYGARFVELDLWPLGFTAEHFGHLAAAIGRPGADT